MVNNFEDKFMDIQSEMISYCLEYSKGQVDTIYAFVAIEPSVQMFSAFFSKDNKILNVTDVNSNKMMMVRFLKDGKSLIENIKVLCRENGSKIPTQMKMIYDVKNNSLKADYRYDLIYTDVDIPTTSFNDWRNEIQQKLINKL